MRLLARRPFWVIAISANKYSQFDVTETGMIVKISLELSRASCHSKGVSKAYRQVSTLVSANMM